MNLTPESIKRLHNQLKEDLGPAICTALEDKRVTGIKVGEDGKVWWKKHVTAWEYAWQELTVGQRMRALGTMASLLGKTIDRKTPDLAGELPLTGDRVQGSVFPSSPEPSFVIRIHAPEVYNLDDYIQRGILPTWQADVLVDAVLDKKNIIIAGAVDSGKTTLANACLQLLDDSQEHLVIIEDTQELQLKAKNVSRKIASETVPMSKQITNALRMDYDRLIIGEVRDAAGYHLMSALVRGKRGSITTVHADNALGALEMFALFMELAGVPVSWRFIRNAFDLIVYIEMTPVGRRVTELMEVVKEHSPNEIPVSLKRLGPTQDRE